MKKIVCLGDSLTDSGRLFSRNGLGNGYVNELNQILNKKTACTIINRGVDGFTVQRVLENLQRDCISQQPDLVTLLVGINDVALIMNTDRSPAQQREMTAQFSETYEELLIEIQKGCQCKVILAEPFIFPYPQEYLNWQPFVAEFSQIIGDLAVRYGASHVLLQEKLDQAVRELGYASITTDGVHLTLQGHKIVAQALSSHL